MQRVGLTCRGRHTTELLMLLLKHDTFINPGHIGPHLSHMGTLGVIRNTQDSLVLYHPHRQGHTAHDASGPSSGQSVATAAGTK